jgi:hypothetical protein
MRANSMRFGEAKVIGERLDSLMSSESGKDLNIDDTAGIIREDLSTEVGSNHAGEILMNDIHRLTDRNGVLTGNILAVTEFDDFTNRFG